MYCCCQLLSCVWLFETPWAAAHQASLSFTVSWSLLRLMSIESMMPFNHLILCCPLFLPSPVLLSIRVFSNESAPHIKWPKYWSFSISPSSEYSGLISFSIYWFNLLAVQRNLKSLLQHHSSKASILQHSAFFMVQLSHLYGPTLTSISTGKTIALTRQTFVGKGMSLLFNMLFKEQASFNFMQSPSAVIFGAQKNEVWHCFHCFPIYFPWSDGTGCQDLSFLNVKL